MDQPTAEHALRQLEPLVGEWTFEAKWLAESRGGAAEGSPSSDTPRGGTPAPACDGGAPEAPDNVSIIGCDPANGTYFQVYSDERGVCRIYEMSIGNQLASAGTTTGTSNTGQIARLRTVGQHTDAETGGFEPPGDCYAPNRLAGGCFRPLSHVSGPILRKPWGLRSIGYAYGGLGRRDCRRRHHRRRVRVRAGAPRRQRHSARAGRARGGSLRSEHRVLRAAMGSRARPDGKVVARAVPGGDGGPSGPGPLRSRADRHARRRPRGGRRRDGSRGGGGGGARRPPGRAS